VRGTFEPGALLSPHPIADQLPGLYQDDDLVLRFAGALDTVLAPVFATLDSGDAYLDPLLAPLDFVRWLAQWVGVDLDASWPEERQRRLVAHGAELYAWRGTARGLAALIETTTGLRAEVEDSGGVAWSGSPAQDVALPGTRPPAVVVRVHIPSGTPVDTARLDALVASAKPAHVHHRVEIVDGT
jgi:phage tail-like protein